MQNISFPTQKEFFSTDKFVEEFPIDVDQLNTEFLQQIKLLEKFDKQIIGAFDIKENVINELKKITKTEDDEKNNQNKELLNSLLISSVVISKRCQILQNVKKDLVYLKQKKKVYQQESNRERTT